MTERKWEPSHPTSPRFEYTVHGEVIAVRDTGTGPSISTDIWHIFSVLERAGYDLGTYDVIYQRNGSWGEIVLGVEFHSLEEAGLDAAFSAFKD